jgi:tetratricopeptide (TPR) repeat protein
VLVTLGPRVSLDAWHRACDAPDAPNAVRIAGLRRREALQVRGRADEAFELLADAGEVARAHRALGRAADALHMQAQARMGQGRTAEAVALYGEALALMERAGEGTSVGAMEVLNGLAEAAPLEGRIGAAEAGYRRAIAVREATGCRAVVPWLNLALLHLLGERWDDAARTGPCPGDPGARRGHSPGPDRKPATIGR